MEHEKSSGGNFALALVFFVMTVLAAGCMLLTALLVWFAGVMGSLALAALIIGGAFTLVAGLIYLCSMRKSLARIRNQMETVYYVAHLAKEGYDWILDKIQLWLRFFGFAK